ncbi:MAG: hypothetical protein HYW48_09195 [Deltaproteobacteria bacterium]|nr:hypothetical protein [Deltaproteobacteria bacterium]
MKRKLNLTVSPELLDVARKISLQRNLSISQMFEQWLMTLQEKELGDSWLDKFHQRNKRHLDKLTDEDVAKLRERRGERWRCVVASALRAGYTSIATRNARDFKGSPITVLTPETILENFSLGM